MVEIEAFELFFVFTRSHEDWDLDELLAVALSALVTGVIWFGIDSRQKGREIARFYEESISNERKMSDARRIQALGTLAGGVAHSGNNLMQPILTLARLSKGNIEGDHPIQGHLDRIIVAAQNASELFNSILKFSRDEADLSQTTDLGELIRENRSLIEAAVPNHIQLNIEISPKPSVAQIPSNNLLDIILALISNSVDSYEGEPGEIEIITRPTPESSQLIIRDRGCGILAKDLNCVFEPFFTNKDVGMGTGLGLAIVKNLTEEAGGNVIATSGIGEGTSIIVNLPIGDDSNQQREDSK